MKRSILSFVLSISLLGILLWSGFSYGQLSNGAAAPPFSLKDMKGQVYELAKMKERPLIILYFFDVESRPSQEGLLTLNRLAGQPDGADLTVWAITLSPQNKVAPFVTQSGLAFPVLLDSANVSDAYQARAILPTVCTLGPGLKVMDYFQGGGKTTETMLVRLAERELQRKLTRLARALSDEAVKKDPQNLKAWAVKGYAALKEKNLNEAESVFKDLSQKGSQGEVLGKEGLSAVYAQKGDTERAIQLAGEVERKAPQRAYVHVVKGDILYAQNKKKEAETEYRAAVRKEEVEPYQAPVRYNQLGRFYGNEGQHAKARELYDRAVAIDPYYIEGTTNKGITYEKEGRWDKALESYREALTLEKNDTFAAVLARKAQEMMDLQKDQERKKRVDQLVKELAVRYRTQEKSRPKGEDTWTSPPMVLSFVDFQEKGAMSERDGYSTVLLAELSSLLNASGRVRVVERVLLERLLEELNLGSSDLANPETALRLGRVLAARLMGTGTLLLQPQGTLLSLRLIDTETSAISQVLTREMGNQGGVEKDVFQLNRDILRTVITKYPLRGFVVRATGDQALVNLGSKQGVVTGTKFEVLEEGEAIPYKGKVLSSAPRSVAQLEAVRVEPDLSYVKILKQERPVKGDDKVQERMEDSASR
jgi:tetratricopeptide (TPR) repeat protein